MEKHLILTLIWMTIATGITVGINKQSFAPSNQIQACDRHVRNNPCNMTVVTDTPNFRDSDPIMDLILWGEFGKCPTPDRSIGCVDVGWEALDTRFINSLYSGQSFQPEEPITVGQMVKYFGIPDQVTMIDRTFMFGSAIFDIHFYYSSLSLIFHSGQHGGTEYRITPDTYIFSWTYLRQEEYQPSVDYWKTQHDPFPSKVTDWYGYGVYTPFNKNGKSL